MFRPRTSQVSHEEFLDVDDDVGISVPGAQAVRGGLLRLIPLTGGVRAEDLGWTRLGWSQEDELTTLPDDIVTRWDLFQNNLSPSSPQLLEYEPVSKFLDIDTEQGEHQFFSQQPGNLAGQRHWSDEVSNARGWVVQARIQAVVDQTGYGPHIGHHMVFDDGVHRERMFIHPTGLFFETNPALDIRCDMTQAREIRVGAKQDDIYVLLDNGLGVIGADGFTGLSFERLLGFGATGVPGRYRTLWDYVNQHHEGVWVDSRDHVLRVYSTTGSTGTTSSYAPKRRILRFDAAYVHTTGDLLNGTTQVTVQYKSSVTPSWSDYATVTITEIGNQKIILSLMPVAGDGTDEVRFAVFQQSTTGAGEPPRVDRVTVITSFETPGVVVTPRYGHKQGGSLHVLDLTTGADIAQRVPSSETGLHFLARFDGDYIDEISGQTGVPSNASFVQGRLGQAAQLGALSDAASPWTSFLDAFAPQVPHGMLSTAAVPVFPSTTGVLELTTGIIGQVSGTASQTLAQRAYATIAGDGYRVPSLTGPGALGFLLQIEKGSVRVKHGSEDHIFTVYDYWTPKKVVIKSAALEDLQFLSAEAESSWMVGAPTAHVRTLGSVAFTAVPHQQDEGFAADVFVTMDMLSEGPLWSRLTGNDGWEIGLAFGGYPYVRAGDGVRSDALTGNYPIRVDELHNLALNYRRFGDHTGLQLLIDGDVAAEKITALDQITQGLANPAVGGVHVMQVEQARMHSDQVDAHRFSVLAGLSNPSFQTAYSVPRDVSNLLLLHFGQRGGAHADDSGNARHPHSLLAGRAGLDRGALFEGRSAYLFWHGAELGLLHTSDFAQSLPQALFARGLFYRTDRVQELYSKWNVGETVGWKVEILVDGSVKVTAKDGTNTRELTSDVVLADQLRRSVYVAVLSTGIVLRIDDVEKTLAGALTSLAAADQDARIGHFLVGYLGEFVLRNAELDLADYDDWRDSTVAKWSPSDDVIFLDGEPVPDERVIHYSPTRKYFNAPAGGPGNVPLHVSLGGILLGAERSFRYTHGYERVIPQDRIDKLVHSTHSVFRIVNEVPPGGVNLAYIHGSDISVDRNVSLIDLSYSRGENLSTYFGGEFPVKLPETGLAFHRYTGQLDTDDMRVSNRSVMRREIKIPTPLFYRYLIGRSRRYVYQPNALTVSDMAVIRNGIKLLDGFGQQITFERFPWEIEVSTKDVHGDDLPTNVFAVTLFSSLPFLEDTSVQVRYTAADALHGFQVQQNFFEIVNPEAAMARVAGTPGHDEYNVDLTPTGTYDLTVGRTGL